MHAVLQFSGTAVLNSRFKLRRAIGLKLVCASRHKAGYAAEAPRCQSLIKTQADKQTANFANHSYKNAVCWIEFYPSFLNLGLKIILFSLLLVTKLILTSSGLYFKPSSE